jgi:hypothetical protein
MLYYNGGGYTQMNTDLGVGFGTTATEVTFSSYVNNITKGANTIVYTSGTHGLVSGQSVSFAGVLGMLQLNTASYFAKVLYPDRISLYTDQYLNTPLDSSGYASYAGGPGIVYLNELIAAVSVLGGVAISENLIVKHDITVHGNIYGASLAVTKMVINPVVPPTQYYLGLTTATNSVSPIYADSVLTYDTTDDRLTVGKIAVTSTATSTSTTTGALTVAGGVGIGGSLFAGNNSVIGDTRGGSVKNDGNFAANLVVVGSHFGNVIGNDPSNPSLLGSNTNLYIVSSNTSTTATAIISFGIYDTTSTSRHGGGILVGRDVSTPWTGGGSLDIRSYMAFLTRRDTNRDIEAMRIDLNGNLLIGSTISNYISTSGVYIAGITQSTSTNTGALVVKGGVGIGGAVYSADGNPLENYLLYTPKVTVTDTGRPPADARVGDFWVDSVLLVQFQYIKDGASAFWIQVNTL